MLPLRDAARWMLTFAGFPLGSVVARFLAGPVDGPSSALLGGLVNGVVLGGVQAWALGRHRPPIVVWPLATGVGLALGLSLGAGAVDYATDATSLVVHSAICGAAVGLAQASVLVRRLGGLTAPWPILLSVAFAGYVAWSVWLLVLSVVLWRSEIRWSRVGVTT
jgi:hypothetical protein